MFEFTVRPDGGDEYKVTAGSRDVLRWERTTKGKTLADLKNGVQMGDLYRIAHITSRRQGLFSGTEQEFEESCELDFEEEEEPDPTRPAP